MLGRYMMIETMAAAPTTPRGSPARSVAIGDVRRVDSRHYTAGTAGTTAPCSPVHTEGTKNDGGVDWSSRTRVGHGAHHRVIADPSHATATVIMRLPSQVVTAPTPRRSSPSRRGTVSTATRPSCASSASACATRAARRSGCRPPATSSTSPSATSTTKSPTTRPSSLRSPRTPPTHPLGARDAAGPPRRHRRRRVADRRGDDPNDPLSPSNVRAVRQSSYGSRPLRR
jgi:hypothetical protein